jgi:hypothetical protein
MNANSPPGSHLRRVTSAPSPRRKDKLKGSVCNTGGATAAAGISVS